MKMKQMKRFKEAGLIRVLNEPFDYLLWQRGTYGMRWSETVPVGWAVGSFEEDQPKIIYLVEYLADGQMFTAKEIKKTGANQRQGQAGLQFPPWILV